MSVRVLGCGGRKYRNLNLAFRVFDKIHADRRISLMIEGGAGGADDIAEAWALSRDVPLCTVEANWTKFGRAAGPIRNSVMLDIEPHLVVAFPGGSGTADMVGKARAKGVEVMEIEE